MDESAGGDDAQNRQRFGATTEVPPLRLFDDVVGGMPARVRGLSIRGPTRSRPDRSMDSAPATREGSCNGVSGGYHGTRCVAPYEWVEGWQRTTNDARKLAEPPSQARRYLDRIEALVEARSLSERRTREIRS